MVPSSVGSSTEAPLTSSFLDLPAELRNQIYGYLYDEITITCTFDFDCKSMLNGASPSYTNLVSPDCLNLLLTCRQIYLEAKPLLDSAAIIVDGDFLGQANPQNFPQHVLRRVRDLTFRYNHFYLLTESSRAFGINFMDPEVCPNLRLIIREAVNLPFEEGDALSFGMMDGMTNYLTQALHVPKSVGFGNERYVAAHKLTYTKDKDGKKHPDLLAPLLLESFPAPAGAGTDLTTAQCVEISNAIIKRRDLTVTTVHRFNVKGALWRKRIDPHLIFEDPAEVKITWDADGLRFERPDFTTRPWWQMIKEAAERSATGDQDRIVREIQVFLQDHAPSEGRGVIGPPTKHMADWFAVDFAF